MNLKDLILEWSGLNDTQRLDEAYIKLGKTDTVYIVSDKEFNIGSVDKVVDQAQEIISLRKLPGMVGAAGTYQFDKTGALFIQPNEYKHAEGSTFPGGADTERGYFAKLTKGYLFMPKIYANKALLSKTGAIVKDITVGKTEEEMKQAASKETVDLPMTSEIKTALDTGDKSKVLKIISGLLKRNGYEFKSVIGMKGSKTGMQVTISK